MSWDFQTDPEFAGKLAWATEFVKARIEPLETLDLEHDDLLRIIAPLQDEVKANGLWAAHLTPELGGQGMGQVALALLHEVLGRTLYAPLVFGNNAPDSGNAELIALGGDQHQKERWLYPLLAGTIRSGFSMTEPDSAGSDPTLLTTRAVRDGGDWVITGRKWFTSNGSIADILIVMAVTDPDAAPHRRASMFVVPRETPGVKVVRDVPTMDHPHAAFGRYGNHAEILYEEVRVPHGNLLGQVGDGFLLAQKRLGPGRIHHAMRWIGQATRAFDMMCERAVSRFSHGSTLADKQMVQTWIADSYADLTQIRLLTLYAAWRMDQVGAEEARTEIAMVKYSGAKVLHEIIDRAIQVHGALGFSTDMPLEFMYRKARQARLVDGADEVHKVAVARRVLRGYTPRDVPSEHIPTRRAAAAEQFAEALEALESGE
ncbi:acyl-CoA dehydrogenase family protein [uncultured Microbacterium sp.]|uniref:acyl-CoA dehydrogenase family protein n=1 Tax=uncultured Microbacterium sp. TaxID=191216 RepID=UPI0035CC8150